MRKILPVLVAFALACGGSANMTPQDPDRCPGENDFWNGEKEVCCTRENGVVSCPTDLK